MSSNVQRESAWHMHMPSVCVQSIDKKGDTDKLGDSKGFVLPHDTSLTERDYIGLSGTSTTATSSAQTITLTNLDSFKCSGAKEKETECRDTELRLGIGPCGKDASKLHAHQQSGHFVQSGHHHHLHPVSHMSQDGSKAQFRCPEGGLGNGNVDFHQSFWPWGPGVAPGRFMIPVPKISMVPAKRPYLEAIGEKNNPSIWTLATNSNTPSEALILERSNHLSSSSAPPLPTPAASMQGGGGGFYTWSCGNTMPTVARAAWQQENCDKTGMDGGTPSENSCPPSRALAPPPLHKPSSAPLVNHSDPVSPSLASKSKVAPHFGSSEQRAVHTPDVCKEEASRHKAPMVGWPPVRSFRKNNLQSAAGGKENGALSDAHKQEEVSNANEVVADQQIKGSSIKEALFVKAKLDGVRICRKVDLTAYSSYDSLKSALQEMFQGFVCNDNTKFDLVRGSNYVLTHEDKDGDWMLVGDVPWRMFVATVKSLRIMKEVDAVGLGKGTNQSQRS